MMPARPIAGRELGWSAELLRSSPLAVHYRPVMAPLSREACDALAHGALPPELLPTPEQVVHGSALSPLMVTHGYALEPGGKSLQVQVFVEAPNEGLVTVRSRFWNASGIDVSLNAGGLNVNAQSLAAVLAGGLAFANPDTAAEAPAAESGHRFPLFYRRKI